jgi:hypothetical protein
MAEAPWKAWSGAKRLQAEFRSLTRAVAAGQLPTVQDVELAPGEDLFKWCVGWGRSAFGAAYAPPAWPA